MCACVGLPLVGVGPWARVSSVVPSGRPENHLAWLASACLPPRGLRASGSPAPFAGVEWGVVRAMVMLELQLAWLVQLPLQWPVPLLSWCGVPVHVGSHWAVAGLPWMLSLHHLPLMSLLPLSSSP